MLERTAGCLETGSLRRLVPGSKNPLKSRRALHSGFWTHGAIDLELSPLWAALLRGPDPIDTSVESQQLKAAFGPGGMLLDFLYPAGTIRFLRQHSGWGAERQDGRRSIAGLAKLGHRLYSSSAKDTSVIEHDTNAAQSASGSTLVERKTFLRKSLGLAATNQYEEAWRLYSERNVAGRERLRLHLIEYLLGSTRVVDAERTTELFNRLDERDRSLSAYEAIIRAFLRLHNVSKAIEMNEAAWSKFDNSTGISHLIAYLFDHSLWSQVLQAWERYETYQSQNPEAQYDSFVEALQLPNIVSQTLLLADHVKSVTESTTQDGTFAQLIKLINIIVRRLLSTDAASDNTTLTKLISVLETWGLDSPDIYESALQRILSTQKDKRPAVRIYRAARAKKKEIKYSTYVLHHLLSIFCQNHSVLGMQQILDDFFQFYENPTRRAYQLCMREFAAQGDADTVHSLFEQFALRSETDKEFQINPDIFAPLLHVHAKRGELSAVLAAFDSIQHRFGMEPTLLCYNIVLNAYCKVRDAEGAVKFFRQILVTKNLRPDDYTFGTMIGLCSMLGDRAQATELYSLAQSIGIGITTSMLDPLVLVHLKDEDLTGAEKICEDNLESEVKGPRTRMWNYLLVAYAMRRDLVNVNRLLRRMTRAKMEYDRFTYSSLMQALVMVGQPTAARSIMTQVMQEAGIKPTSFHYAVLMGGYHAIGESRMVFLIRNELVQRTGLGHSSSTRLLAMKAAAAEDGKLLEYGTEEQQSQRALEIFQETIGLMDPMDNSQSAKKGAGDLPQDISYSTMFHSFIMFVLAQQNDHKSVQAIHERYLQTLPASRQESRPIKILTPLLISKMRTHDFEGAQECWDLAVSYAKKRGRGSPRIIPARNPSGEAGIEESSGPIVTDHQLDLSQILHQHMMSLVFQNRTDEIPPLIDSLLADGFILSSNNWNHYIEVMARRHRYKLAFDLCEQRLMPGWSGWARVRWQALERNRLPMEVRNLKKQPRFLRPQSKTLLYLARVYLELQTSAAESPAQQILLAELERSCPMTVQAISTMQRSDDELERYILRDFVV